MNTKSVEQPEMLQSVRSDQRQGVLKDNKKPMGKSIKNFVPSLLLVTCTFPMIAVSTTPTSMYKKTVFGILRTKFPKYF